MNDRPESHNKKIHFEHLAHLNDSPKFYMSELEFLEQKIEAKLDTINEQLSALFQLSTKFLNDSMDATIETDFQTKKFLDTDQEIRKIKQELRDRAGGEVMNSEHITDLYDRIFEIEKLNPQENHHIKDLENKLANE